MNRFFGGCETDNTKQIARRFGRATNLGFPVLSVAGTLQISLRRRLGYFTNGAQAPGAETEAHRFPVESKLGCLNVSNPAAVGAPLRVAYVVSKLSGFIATIASHN